VWLMQSCEVSVRFSLCCACHVCFRLLMCAFEVPRVHAKRCCARDETKRLCTTRDVRTLLLMARTTVKCMRYNTAGHVATYMTRHAISRLPGNATSSTMPDSTWCSSGFISGHCYKKDGSITCHQEQL
jgi:hypothetical protein